MGVRPRRSLACLNISRRRGLRRRPKVTDDFHRDRPLTSALARAGSTKPVYITSPTVTVDGKLLVEP